MYSSIFVAKLREAVRRRADVLLRNPDKTDQNASCSSFVRCSHLSRLTQAASGHRTAPFGNTNPAEATDADTRAIRSGPRFELISEV